MQREEERRDRDRGRRQRAGLRRLLDLDADAAAGEVGDEGRVGREEARRRHRRRAATPSASVSAIAPSAKRTCFTWPRSICWRNSENASSGGAGWRRLT